MHIRLGAELRTDGLPFYRSALRLTVKGGRTSRQPGLRLHPPRRVASSGEASAERRSPGSEEVYGTQSATVRVDGVASLVVLGTGTTSSLVYLGSLGAATWAAFASLWWLVAVAAAAGGIGYAFGARQWWHAYQNDPVARAGGASPRMLVVIAVIACLGLAALLVIG